MGSTVAIQAVWHLQERCIDIGTHGIFLSGLGPEFDGGRGKHLDWNLLGLGHGRQSLGDREKMSPSLFKVGGTSYGLSPPPLFSKPT